jgi:hypothetical protein
VNKSPSSSSLPFLSVSLLHHRPPLAGDLPCCQLSLTALTPRPGPPARPPADRPTLLALTRPATSCRRRPQPPCHAAGRQQLLQLARTPSWFRLTSRSPPRLLLPPRAAAFRFSAPSPLSTAARPPPHSLLAAVSQLRGPTFATRCFPGTAPSHRSSIASSSPSSRAYATQNTAPAILFTTAVRCHCRPAAPPPLGPHQAHHQHYIYAWKLPSHFFAAFLHSDRRSLPPPQDLAAPARFSVEPPCNTLM